MCPKSSSKRRPGGCVSGMNVSRWSQRCWVWCSAGYEGPARRRPKSHRSVPGTQSWRPLSAGQVIRAKGREWKGPNKGARNPLATYTAFAGSEMWVRKSKNGARYAPASSQMLSLSCLRTPGLVPPHVGDRHAQVVRYVVIAVGILELARVGHIDHIQQPGGSFSV
jgi:hypothetical protein